MVKATLRTKSLGTKVTEEEYARLASLAGGRALSEWVREVLLAELVGLRTILLNVLYRLVNGEKISAEEMRQLIERADQDKSRKAAARLAGRKRVK